MFKAIKHNQKKGSLLGNFMKSRLLFRFQTLRYLSSGVIYPQITVILSFKEFMQHQLISQPFWNNPHY